LTFKTVSGGKGRSGNCDTRQARYLIATIVTDQDGHGAAILVDSQVEMFLTKPFTLDPQDRDLFRRTVGPITPLRCDRVDPVPRHPAPYPRFTLADAPPALNDMLSDYFEPADLDTGEELCYRREGVQQTVLRKLRRGQFQVGPVLDLHGMTVVTAREALTMFLHSARHEGRTCVRIIHGKGHGSRYRGPVLKPKINHWLRQCDEVLAFCSARPVDGGTGALYVLLRRQS
jgi:DNA-nicking Smr family endonuclease